MSKPSQSINSKDGWLPWIWQDPWTAPLDNPYKHKQIEIWRREWEKPVTVDPNNLPPAYNVVDLFWRWLP